MKRIAVCLVLFIAASAYAQPPDLALRDAAAKGDLAAVKKLLDAGATVDVSSERDESAVVVAMRNGHREIVTLFLDRLGPRAISTSLLEAILAREDKPLSERWWAAVSELAKNPDEAIYPVILLHSATAAGHLRSIAFLLEQKVPIDATGFTGDTALLWAIGGHQSATVRFLLEKGADVEKDSEIQGTPLTYATFDGGPDVLRAVLAAKPKLNRPNQRGETALTIATQFGLTDEVEMLLAEEEIDVNASDAQKRTPLMHAAATGDDSIVRMLLRAKANRTLKDAGGNTALALARANGFDAIAAMLAAEGVPEEPAQVTPVTPAERAASLAWVERWLVRQELNEIEKALDTTFRSATAADYDGAEDPAAKPSGQSIRRLLDAPFSSGCLEKCPTIATCARNVVDPAEPVDVRAFRVESAEAAWVPSLKPRVGQELIQASFHFDCGLGVNLVLTRGEAPSIIGIELGMAR